MSADGDHEHRHGPSVDWARSACLCDVGLPGYVATVCVCNDGSDVLWLVRRSELREDSTATHGRADQPHERLGRLPQWMRERIWGDRLRCGRPRADGKPCRHRVSELGHACGVHSQQGVGP